MSYNTNTQQNFLNKYSKLSQNSNEWNQLEYDLQLALGSTTAIVKHIWSISNPKLTFEFDKNNKNLLTLDSFIETCKLKENTSLQKICQKGFEFSNKDTGLVFPTGHIQLSDNSKNKIYEVLMLKIASGKSYCVPFKNGDFSKSLNYTLPADFDSIYLYDEDEDRNSGIFRHKYIIFKNEQILPMYIIQFEFNEEKENQLTLPQCDVCEDNEAKVYCKQDDANLCYNCDEECHLKGGKLASKHIRIKIQLKPKSFGICSNHTDANIELYCTVCHQLLCVYCKISGSHSQGEAAGHNLVKIQDAHKKALSESKEFDPLLEKRKNQLSDQLNQIDEKIKEINNNASNIEEQIYKVLQGVLEQLQEKTKQKMSLLIADQLELKRQYDQIQWMESFLKYQQEILNPSDYLNAWARHSALRNRILTQSKKDFLSNVQPDLRLVISNFSVTSEQKQLDDYDNDQQQNQVFLDQSQNNIDRQGILQGYTSNLRCNIFQKHSNNNNNNNNSNNINNKFQNDKNTKLMQSIAKKDQIKTMQFSNDDENELNNIQTKKQGGAINLISTTGINSLQAKINDGESPQKFKSKLETANMLDGQTSRQTDDNM